MSRKVARVRAVEEKMIALGIDALTDEELRHYRAYIRRTVTSAKNLLAQIELGERKWPDSLGRDIELASKREQLESVIEQLEPIEAMYTEILEGRRA